MISASIACVIGCVFLLSGLIALSILENVVFYNSLAFTISPWFTFLWLLGGVVFSPYDRLSPSIFVVWFVRFIFCVTCILTCVRLCLFFWRYKNKVIPTFQSPKIYSLAVEPRSF